MSHIVRRVSYHAKQHDGRTTTHSCHSSPIDSHRHVNEHWYLHYCHRSPIDSHRQCRMISDIIGIVNRCQRTGWSSFLWSACPWLREEAPCQSASQPRLDPRWQLARAGYTHCHVLSVVLTPRTWACRIWHGFRNRGRQGSGRIRSAEKTLACEDKDCAQGFESFLRATLP